MYFYLFSFIQLFDSNSINLYNTVKTINTACITFTFYVFEHTHRLLLYFELSVGLRNLWTMLIHRIVWLFPICSSYSLLLWVTLSDNTAVANIFDAFSMGQSLCWPLLQWTANSTGSIGIYMSFSRASCIGIESPFLPILHWSHFK